MKNQKTSIDSITIEKIIRFVEKSLQNRISALERLSAINEKNLLSERRKVKKIEKRVNAILNEDNHYQSDIANGNDKAFTFLQNSVEKKYKAKPRWMQLYEMANTNKQHYIRQGTPRSPQNENDENKRPSYDNSKNSRKSRLGTSNQLSSMHRSKQTSSVAKEIESMECFLSEILYQSINCDESQMIFSKYQAIEKQVFVERGVQVGEDLASEEYEYITFNYQNQQNYSDQTCLRGMVPPPEELEKLVYEGTKDSPYSSIGDLQYDSCYNSDNFIRGNDIFSSCEEIEKIGQQHQRESLKRK